MSDSTNKRDETEVDLVGIPMWLARWPLEHDKRLQWSRLIDADHGNDVYSLVAIDENQASPNEEVRRAVVDVKRCWEAEDKPSDLDKAIARLMKAAGLE